MKVLLTIALFLSLKNVSAQSDAKKINPSASSVEVKTDSLSHSKKLEFIEGTIPTPETQGFIKYEINGKEVYVKETDGIRIQYEPK